MRVNQVDNVHFGITTKGPTKKPFKCWPGSYDLIREGTFKKYSFEIHDLFVDGKKDSTLIMLKKYGHWIKSKLKYSILGKKNTFWYTASDKYKNTIRKNRFTP